MILMTMPQYSQTEKPQSKLGIDTHKFRLAIDLPVLSQKASSSTFQCSGVLAMIDTQFAVEVEAICGEIAGVVVELFSLSA